MKIKTRLFRFLLPVAIIAISIFTFQYLVNSKPPTQQKLVEEKTWYVDSQTVKFASHAPIIQLIGKIQSTEEINISSAIETDVIKRWVNVGDRVNKGQILLNLNPTTFKLIRDQRQAEVDEMKALIDEEISRHQTEKSLLEKEQSLLTIANNAVTRAQTLEKSAMASSSQLDDAKRTAINQQIAITQRTAIINNHPIRLLQLKSKLKSAISRLSIASEKLSHTTLYSPIDGTITKIDLDQSEHVRIGTQLASLYDHNNLEISAFVPEKHIPIIKQSLLKSHLLIGTIYSHQQLTPITLQRIGGMIQDNTAGTNVYFSIDENQSHYLLGQTISVRLVLPAINNTLALPSDAIYGVDNIFIIHNQRLKRVNIHWLGETLSKRNEINVLISSDFINNGESILVSKFANAVDGLRVKSTTELSKKQ